MRDSNGSTFSLASLVSIRKLKDGVLYARYACVAAVYPIRILGDGDYEDSARQYRTHGALKKVPDDQRLFGIEVGSTQEWCIG